MRGSKQEEVNGFRHYNIRQASLKEYLVGKNPVPVNKAKKYQGYKNHIENTVNSNGSNGKYSNHNLIEVTK